MRGLSLGVISVQRGGSLLWMISSVLGEDFPMGAPYLSYVGGRDLPFLLISHAVGSYFLDCFISALGWGLFLRFRI